MDEIIQRIKLIKIADGAGIGDYENNKINNQNKQECLFSLFFLLNTIQIILKFFQMLFLYFYLLQIKEKFFLVIQIKKLNEKKI